MYNIKPAKFVHCGITYKNEGSHDNIHSFTISPISTYSDTTVAM